MSIREKYGLVETAVLKLKDGNDDPMLGDDGQPCTVEVVKPGSRAHMNAEARRQTTNVQSMTRKGKMKKSGDELAQENAEYAADVTRSISENLAREFPGKTGRDLLMALYTDEQLGFLASEQVAAYQRDTANFTKGSTTT